MAKFVLRDAMVVINGTDLSDQARAVTITTSRPEVDVTSFGADFQEFVGGIPDASMEIEFFQNFAAAKVDATLWPLVNSDTAFTIAIRPVAAAISTTNPEYQMSSLLLGDYNPIAGDVGSAATTTVTFRNAGQAGIVKDVTP